MSNQPEPRKQDPNDRRIGPESIAAVVDYLNQTEVNRAKDLELRAKELELEDKNSERGFQYSLKALESTNADRANERADNRKRDKHRYYAIGVFLSIATGLVVFLVLHQQSDMAEEIIKAAAFLISGALGGYGFGKARSAKEQSESKDQSGS